MEGDAKKERGWGVPGVGSCRATTRWKSQQHVESVESDLAGRQVVKSKPFFTEAHRQQGATEGIVVFKYVSFRWSVSKKRSKVIWWGKKNA